ncbi:unnamed protein product [Gongylonema pulchrum]|uniref:Ion_trans domain-containing protein n=1 Tax=Gongylonema pulchrum TaxID=637853 RepID=A0A183DL41_9BILA|nr:unnamed protein product [Gongylonema pulchrum]
MNLAALIRDFYHFVTSGLRPLVPLLILVIYTLFGAFIFMLVEGSNEQNEIETRQRERSELIEVTTSFSESSLNLKIAFDIWNNSVFR